MASPTPSDFVTTDFATADTSFVVNIPTSAVAGDRVAVGFGYAVTGQTITPPGSGVIADETIEQATGGTNGLYALVYEVQGSETTITIGTSVSTKAAAVACRVEGDSDSTPAVITTAAGVNGPPDPPASSDPGASAIDVLVVALGSMGGETALTAAPTNYSNFTEADSGTAGAITSNSRTAIGTRQLTTDAPEDPGAFTGGDATQEWAAATILFFPAPAGGGETASIAQTLPALTQAVVAEAILEAAIAQTLPGLTQAAVAEALLAAALDSTLPGLTQAANAEALQEAVLAQVLPALTQDASATVGSVATATIAQTLPALTQALTAEAVIEAAVAAVLPALGQDATAEAIIEAVLAQDLPALTQAVVAEAIVEGAIAQTLPGLTQAATAEIVAGLSAAISQTLPALIQSVTAEAILTGLEATVAQVLPALSANVRVVFSGGGKDGFVVWRHTRNPNKTKRRLPFRGGIYR